MRKDDLEDLLTISYLVGAWFRRHTINMLLIVYGFMIVAVYGSVSASEEAKYELCLDSYKVENVASSIAVTRYCDWEYDPVMSGLVAGLFWPLHLSKKVFD